MTFLITPATAALLTQSRYNFHIVVFFPLLGCFLSCTFFSFSPHGNSNSFPSGWFTGPQGYRMELPT